MFLFACFPLFDMHGNNDGTQTYIYEYGVWTSASIVSR